VYGGLLWRLRRVLHLKEILESYWPVARLC